MELLDVGPRHAVISYSDLTRKGRYHELDCQYNRGMLACVPEALRARPGTRRAPGVRLQGRARMRLYGLRWESGTNEVRFALGAAVVGAAHWPHRAFDPALLPFGAAIAGVAAVAAWMRSSHQARAVRRQLEAEAREQSEVAERLIASLQDLVSELRLDEVLAKITANAQAAVVGKEFALLVDWR